MDARTLPLVAPTLAFLAGMGLVWWLPSPLAVPGLVAVVALGIAVSRGPGGLWKPAVAGLAWAAAGALTATVAGVPAEPPGRFTGGQRPLTAVVRVEGPWRATAGGWSARGRAELLRHRARVHLGFLPVWLQLPSAEGANDADPPPPGSRLRLRGFLDRPPGHGNGLPTSPGPWRFSVPSPRFVDVAAGPGPVGRWSHRLRRRLERRLDVLDGLAPGAEGAEGGDGPGLVRALVLGDPGRLDPFSVIALRRCGLGHLLALSGLHLGLLLGLLTAARGLVAALLSRIPGLPRGMEGPKGQAKGRSVRAWSWVLILGILAGWLAVAGLRPSLARASLVAAGLGLSLLLQRPPSPLNTLALAALLLVLHRPEVLGDLGFQLSFAATAGLLLLAPGLRPPAPRGSTSVRSDSRRAAFRWSATRRGPWRRRWAWLARAWGMTLAAQLATVPWAGPVFHGLHPLAPVLHLPALPWVTVVLGASFLVSALLLVSPADTVSALAPALVPFLDVLARPLGLLQDLPASTAWFLPWLSPGPAAWGLAVAGGILVGWLCRLRGWGGVRPALLTGALGLAVGGALAVPAPPPHPRLVMLDVGQGTAVLIQDGPRALLVDGGGRTGGSAHGAAAPRIRRSPGGGVGPRVLVPALLAEGVRRLDAVVLSHPDLDHCGGLVEVAAYLPVAEVWMARGWEGDPCADRLAAVPGAIQRRLAAGAAGRLGRWRWRVLHPEWTPPREAGEITRADRNGRSLVLALEAPGGRRVLLPGDLEKAGEAMLLGRFRGAARARLAADVLLVGHHGSRTSSGTPFLAAVGRGRSFRALISAGRANPYGHPAPEVVERLRRRRGWVLTTAAHGRVRLTFFEDGTVRTR